MTYSYCAYSYHAYSYCAYSYCAYSYHAYSYCAYLVGDGEDISLTRAVVHGRPHGSRLDLEGLSRSSQ